MKLKFRQREIIDDDKLVLHFLDFITLSKSVSKLLSPLVLIILTGAVVVLVTGVYQALIEDQEGLLTVITSLSSLEQLVYISLVFVGQHIKNIVRKKNGFKHK